VLGVVCKAEDGIEEEVGEGAVGFILVLAVEIDEAVGV
jgi:hypothetical protein